MTSDHLSAPSVILEWETVQQGGIPRVRQALRDINQQFAALRESFERQPELILCFDRASILEADLQAILTEAAIPDAWACRILLCPVPSTANYYEKKNIGARLSSNDILLFFDTDLLPEGGWLRGMLQPFQQWHVSVVVGATHLDHASIYDMAVALFWIFSPATQDSPLRPTRRLVSNNIAFRRSLFLRFPFPDRPTYRGQCTELGLQLMNAGITMYEQTGARASHPPPPGFSGFVSRAWSAGHDEHYYHALSSKTSLSTGMHQFLVDCKNTSRRIKERKAALNPNLIGHAAGWTLGISYYAIKAAGYLAALTQSLFSSNSRLATG
jgi:hypothetical protein